MRNIFLQKHNNNNINAINRKDEHIQCHHLDTLEKQNDTIISDSKSNGAHDPWWNLLVVPLDCNLTGRITNVTDIKRKFTSSSSGNHHKIMYHRTSTPTSQWKSS